MRTPFARFIFTHYFCTCLLATCLLTSCAPAVPVPPPSLPDPVFFYLRAPAAAAPSLVLQAEPGAAQGQREIPLTFPQGCSFWSLNPAPVEPWLAVELQCSYGPTLRLLDTRDGTTSTLPGDAGLDSLVLGWSPDGTTIYLKIGTLSNPQVVSVDAATHHVTPLPIPPNTYNLAVAPDGSRLLYAWSNGMGLGSEIRYVDAKGNNAQHFMADAGKILGLMRFAPDGKRVAYVRLPDDQTEFPPAELWLANADGTNAHQLAGVDGGHGLPPVWSPDSPKIAFAGRAQPDDPNSMELALYDLGTSRLSASGLSLQTPPVWAPDGTKVYFTRAIDDRMELWFYEISTGKAGMLLEDACCAGWLH
jgi:Tol biopolymer transport system component